MFLFLKSLYWIFHLFICFYVHFFRVKYHKSPSLTLCNKHHVFPDFFLSEHNKYLFPLIFPVSLLLIFVLRVAWDRNNFFFDFQIPFPGMCWDQPSLTDGIKNVKRGETKAFFRSWCHLHMPLFLSGCLRVCVTQSLVHEMAASKWWRYLSKKRNRYCADCTACTIQWQSV